ncbi:hypothetical protein Tco_1145984 [Tanacetum coccineum]
MEMWIAIERPKNRVNRLERTRCKDQSVLDFGEVYFSRWRNPWSRITLFRNQDIDSCWGLGNSLVVSAMQQDWDTCFNSKGLGHYAKNAWKPSGLKDYAITRETMMMCKQAEQGIGSNYSSMAKGIQEVSLKNPVSTGQPLEQENKTILKQLKKANASLTQELEKCKTNLDETNSALGEAISCRDSCLIALQNKQNEFEKITRLDLVKKSLLTKSQLEGYLKENTKVISDLKVKEEKDIDKMIEMDKQLKFLNEIVYTRNQSIQTIHMLAPKCATYNGRLTFANPRFAPDREETLTLITES